MDIDKTSNGRFVLRPKVLVERLALEEHRVTAVVDYQSAFTKPNSEAQREAEGRKWPAAYWYAIGRDNALERELASTIERRVAR